MNLSDNLNFRQYEFPSTEFTCSANFIIHWKQDSHLMEFLQIRNWKKISSQIKNHKKQQQQQQLNSIQPSDFPFKVFQVRKKEKVLLLKRWFGEGGL